jgi:hypothetical protein
MRKSVRDGSGAQTYYLKDGPGNTVALCNGSGTVTATYTGACPELAEGMCLER